MKPRVSVIMPMDRPGSDALRAVDAVLAQRTDTPFELVVVSGARPDLPHDPRLRTVVVEDRNPATRRNVAAAAAEGEILAFVDDDAFADPEWIASAVAYLDANAGVAIVGGPDPAPGDSSVAELVSETLLATPLVGSGILCHENRPGIREVHSPHDLALVNLFVRRDAFEAACGFDEKIGYIGEDTSLLASVLRSARAVYHAGVVVRHRRRAFPAAYLRQRWRYRTKTGEMLVRGDGTYARSWKIWALLGAGVVFLVALATAPPVALALAIGYALVVTVLGVRATHLPVWMWWAIPPSFLLHHATYFAGIVVGAIRGIARKE